MEQDNDKGGIMALPQAARATHGTEPKVSALRVGIANADYRHGVDVASAVAFRVLRALDLPDEQFVIMALALSECRKQRPLYGAQFPLTEVERDLFAEKVAQVMSAREGQDPEGLEGDSPASAVSSADAP